MKITQIAANQLLNEFTKLKVVVTFSNKSFIEVCTTVNDPKETEAKDENKLDTKVKPFSFSMTFRPFTIEINNKFISSVKDPFNDNSQIVDSQYITHIDNLRDKVITEIEENINLRIGKWDILNYLTFLESELKEVRKNFKMSEEIHSTSNGAVIIKPDDQFEMDLFTVYENKNITINTRFEPNIDTSDTDIDFVRRDHILSRYWDIQVNVIERLIRYIEPRKRVIETTDDYVKVIDILSEQPSLQWTKTDTDLLELIIALYESGAIQNTTKDITQKEAIQVFSDFFGKEIKDQYKKLNAARSRKKEDPGFIIKMQKALEEYYKKLDNRL